MGQTVSGEKEGLCEENISHSCPALLKAEREIREELTVASVVEFVSLARTVMEQYISECDFWPVGASAKQRLSLCLHLCGQPYQSIKQIR